MLDETEIVEKYSEIIFALDEIVLASDPGSITLPQVNSNLLMESREEELQELIEKVSQVSLIELN